MVDIEIRDGWQSEIVAVQPPAGRLRFLLRVRKERCPGCSRGIRTVSVWSTRRGFAEEIAWCAHCFNATCRRVTPRADEHQRCADLQQNLRHRAPGACWDAVRPALEDLERRGLL